jgi:thermitase
MAQGEGILVGHPDTGYSDHPQLNEPGRLLVAQGFDFEDDDADARDDFSGFFPGHGTSTGSVIMSGMDSTASIVGVAPRCKLIPLRVTTSVVLTSFSKLAEAIRFAADQGHHVLSISLGGPFWSRYLSRAVDYALERGVIIVSAAGNVWPFVVYPARLDGVIAAAACNCARSVWPDSATGPAVDITAPGQSVWRALAERSGFSTGRSSGTSFATAIVAGTAALWLAHHNRDHLLGRYGARGIPRVFKELLLSHGFDRPPGWDTTNLGPGILNAARLLSAPLPLTAPANALRTLRAVPGPRSRNQIDEILELFPGEDSARVRRGLARFLDVADRELNTALRDVADEIAYLAVTDLDFRSQLRSGGAPRRARRAPSAAPKRVRATRPVMPPMSTHLKRLVTP